MIDEVAMQLALRVRAMTLTVATTGAISISATAAGYVRATGSFQADGFWPGMELLASGFGTAANNGRAVITAVTPLELTAVPVVVTTNPSTGIDTITRPPTVVEAAGAGRVLTVGLPAFRAWENTTFQPTPGIPWVEEQYIPGPASQVTLGPNGDLEALPMYAIYVNLSAASGLTVKRYVNALRLLFAPRTAIPLASGDVLRVRSDTGPYAGQLQQGQPGFVTQPLTIPLRLRTQNSI